MILVISHLGFEGGICHLIALVPVHCFLITFINLCIMHGHGQFCCLSFIDIVNKLNG